VESSGGSKRLRFVRRESCTPTRGRVVGQ
jgi:hypothetical protein